MTEEEAMQLRKENQELREALEQTQEQLRVAEPCRHTLLNIIWHYARIAICAWVGSAWRVAEKSLMFLPHPPSRSPNIASLKAGAPDVKNGTKPPSICTQRCWGKGVLGCDWPA